MYQPPSHWEAAFAFLLMLCIAAVGVAAYRTVNATQTACYQLKMVQR